MLKKILSFYQVSSPSSYKLTGEKAYKTYKKLRFQAFVAATLGYSLYYVCRTSLNVMKQPIIDAGIMDATQLGIVGACLYWTYAVGKFVNGFLADYCNIKKFMATGLILSAFANFVMGILGVWQGSAGFSSAFMFLMFAIMWTINGWSQSMGSPPAIISSIAVFTVFFTFSTSIHSFSKSLLLVMVSITDLVFKCNALYITYFIF